MEQVCYGFGREFCIIFGHCGQALSVLYSPAIMSRELKTFTEYLGDIDTEALLQNLKNVNTWHNSIDYLRQLYPRGFSVKAELTEVKKLVRFVLEAN